MRYIVRGKFVRHLNPVIWGEDVTWEWLAWSIPATRHATDMSRNRLPMNHIRFKGFVTSLETFWGNCLLYFAINTVESPLNKTPAFLKFQNMTTFMIIAFKCDTRKQSFDLASFVIKTWISRLRSALYVFVRICLSVCSSGSSTM